jgi:hypothetical protein
VPEFVTSACTKKVPRDVIKLGFYFEESINDVTYKNCPTSKDSDVSEHLNSPI